MLLMRGAAVIEMIRKPGFPETQSQLSKRVNRQSSHIIDKD